jgi:hypothetical protein
MKTVIVLAILMMTALAMVPAVSAETAETVIPPPQHLHCYLDPTPPGAWVDCIAETRLNTIVDTALWSCERPGYSCESTTDALQNN